MSDAPLARVDGADPVTHLLTSARTQQQMAEDSLLRLNAHAAGLDAVVREQIHRSFISECGDLIEEARRSSEALIHLHRAARSYLGWSSLITAILSIVSALVMVYHYLPSPAEQSRLRREEATLRASVARLTELGGKVALRRCGPAGRVCVEVDLGAPVYGEAGDFYVLKGY